MRTRSQLLAVLFAAGAGLFLVTSPLDAKDFPVKITAARVGLPPGGKVADREDSGHNPYVSRFACWSPVYVDLELVGGVSEPAELLIEAADPDEINTTLTVPLNLTGAGTGTKVVAADLGAIGYVRPAGPGEVTVTVRVANGGKVLSEPFRVRSLHPRDALSYVVLSLGGPCPGFDLPRPVGSPDPGTGLRGGRVELTQMTQFGQLPDQWFGYETADLVVLNTAPGSAEFLRKLFSDGDLEGSRAKRTALAEWVRRGGRLVVTVGGNAGLVSQLPALQELLPVAVNPASPSRLPGTLVLYWGARESSQTSSLSGALGLKSGSFPVANFLPKPDRSARVLIPPPDRSGEKQAVAVQSSYGLGRVTVIGFDLDRPPFTDFSQRAEFWDWILREGGANRASVGSDGKPKPGATGPTEEEDEAAVALRAHTDTFEGVPVVSFGWIALLIVLYLLLIGPIEYFFLKRVLGRLELTWITFPIIVLTVSLAAYFSAYSLKGRELKVNKVDVIDVDPNSGRVYGTTWFTIFSPRIETYGLGITPGEGWSADATPPGTDLSWVGAPRGGRASLLRRSYQYHSGADGVANGLEKVPVQVWSTKSFVANWSGRIDPAAPIVESRLEHPPGDRSAVIGTFVNRIPVPVLSDCVVFYSGQAFPLPGGTIRSGETIRLILDRGTLANQWLQKESRLDELLRRVPGYAERPGATKAAIPQPGTADTPALMGGAFPLAGILFHEASLTHGEGVIPRNASLRRLDQSWRLKPDNRDEVILLGRAAPPRGPAEEVLSGANAASRLWLKGIPGAGESRTPIPGTGRQETWVRVYLPVK